MRIMARQLLTASLFVACVAAAAAQAPAPDTWPQFRGGPTLAGVAAGPLSPTLKVAWSHEAGDAVESSAAIADGRVFVGVGSGHLLALSLADGKVLWKYAVEQGVGESSPAVSNGIVYVGDLSGMVHAVNATDGKGLWTFKTKGEI